MAIPTKTLQNHKPLKPREKKHKEEEKNQTPLTREKNDLDNVASAGVHENGVFEGNDGLGFGRGNTRVFSKFVAFKLHQWEQFTRIR
jgi:hypothetical protein